MPETAMRTDLMHPRYAPSRSFTPPMPPERDGLIFEASHQAALHRGLLLILTMAILVLLPAIVWSGATGPSWMDSPAKRNLGVMAMPALPDRTPTPLLTRIPMDPREISDCFSW